ncbi:hypothetical protein AYI69_g610 [Smittium culicis]|uniref:Uncharacterized protein n=1 Tax=Smittium culicis TaxID=133412 RepID=A0A1R1YSL5_9FUNG|nr:hypothetical protein AYI69_g610 [Smittium culicis]
MKGLKTTASGGIDPNYVYVTVAESTIFVMKSYGVPPLDPEVIKQNELNPVSTITVDPDLGIIIETASVVGSVSESSSVYHYTKESYTLTVLICLCTCIFMYF